MRELVLGLVLSGACKRLEKRGKLCSGFLARSGAFVRSFVGPLLTHVSYGGQGCELQRYKRTGLGS